MVLIIACLLPLIVLTFLSVIFGNELLSTEIIHRPEGLFENESFYELLEVDIISTSQFDLSGLYGAIAIIVVVATISIIMGIRILGSGLSETSIKSMMIAFGYTGLWFVLSLISANLIMEIEIYGSIIYIILTIGYVIGVFQKLTEG